LCVTTILKILLTKKLEKEIHWLYSLTTETAVMSRQTAINLQSLLYYGLPWLRCWQQVWKGTEPLWLSGWCSPAGCPAGTGYGQMARKTNQVYGYASLQ